jgi:hypothetical protein
MKTIQKSEKIKLVVIVSGIFGCCIFTYILLFVKTTTLPLTKSHAAAGVPESGLPAIAPTHTSLSSNAVNFSLSDAQTYIFHNPFVGGDSVNGKVPIVESMQFVTAKTASQLMNGEDVGVDDNHIVLFVKEKGPFVLNNVPLPPGTQIPVFTYGETVYDATTGNIIDVSGEN